MRKASATTVALIVAIALYFTLSWGVDGLRALASPNYGLDDVWRSRLQRFPMGSSNRQLPSNIAKAYTCAEENTGNPSPEGNAFLCDPCYQSICFSGTVQTGECCRTLSRRGH